MATANEERYVERRSQYLSANKIGLKFTVATAVSWSELGYTKSGIAEEMDVADTTAKSYLRAAADAYPGILKRSADDISWEPEAGVDDLPSAGRRECPVCLNDNLCSPQEAEAVFMVSSWGATEMLEDADRVCSVCLSVRRDGSWERMKTIDSRAYELAQGSSTKGSDDYREVITGGIEPSGRAGDDPAPAVDDDESEDMDW
jgi:hypothetical protein